MKMLCLLGLPTLAALFLLAAPGWERADDLCVVRSMTSNFPEHISANYFLHSGSGLQGRPSMGAW